MQVPAGTSATDEHVYLIGRPPLGEFLGFVRVMSVDGQTADQGALAAEWRAANDHVRELETNEAGLADNLEIGSLPAGMEPLRDQLMADPVMQRSFQIVPSTVGIVELNRLVVYQKHINLAYVRQLQTTMPAVPTEEQLFEFCLPGKPVLPPYSLRQVAPNSYVFLSPSDDFRFLEGVLLTPDQVVGYAPSGRPVAVLGVVIGYGSNYLNAFEVEGRLILNNGSHRAFALQEMGIANVPCLIQHVSRREEFEVVGAKVLQDDPDTYLKSPRPALLKDYFDPALRKLVVVPRKRRMVKLSFGVEQSDVPE